MDAVTGWYKETPVWVSYPLKQGLKPTAFAASAFFPMFESAIH